MAGTGAIAQGESPQQRIARYTLQIQTYPDSISGYLNRARAYNEKGDYTAALADCNKALGLDPHNKIASRARAQAYYFLRKYELSISDFNEVLKENPRDTMAWNWRGNDYYYLNKLELAVSDYSKALQLNPSYAMAWFNRASASYRAAV